MQLAIGCEELFALIAAFCPATTEAHYRSTNVPVKHRPVTIIECPHILQIADVSMLFSVDKHDVTCKAEFLDVVHVYNIKLGPIMSSKTADAKVRGHRSMVFAGMDEASLALEGARACA